MIEIGCLNVFPQHAVRSFRQSPTYRLRFVKTYDIVLQMMHFKTSF